MEDQVAFWVARRWWAGVLAGVAVLLVGVGLIVSDDETGVYGTDTTWIKYTIAPLCILAGIAAIAAGLVRRLQDRGS